MLLSDEQSIRADERAKVAQEIRTRLIRYMFVNANRLTISIGTWQDFWEQYGVQE